MAKSQVSARSRAARRATSPSLNAGRIVDDVQAEKADDSGPLKQISQNRVSNQTSSPGGGGGISKRQPAKRITHRQRVRQDRMADMAECVAERIEVRTKASVRAGRRVNDRRAEWGDINKRIGGPRGIHSSRAGRFDVLGLASSALGEKGGSAAALMSAGVIDPDLPSLGGVPNTAVPGRFSALASAAAVSDEFTGMGLVITSTEQGEDADEGEVTGMEGLGNGQNGFIVPPGPLEQHGNLIDSASSAAPVAMTNNA